MLLVTFASAIPIQSKQFKWGFLLGASLYVQTIDLIIILLLLSLWSKHTQSSSLDSFSPWSFFGFLIQVFRAYLLWPSYVKGVSHHPLVVTVYGLRRYFVHCPGLAVVKKYARGVGIEDSALGPSLHVVTFSIMLLYVLLSIPWHCMWYHWLHWSQHTPSSSSVTSFLQVPRLSSSLLCPILSFL